MSELIDKMASLLKLGEVYEIRQGDTLDSIVKTHPVALSNKIILPELLAANPQVAPSKLQIGQKIHIPTGNTLSKIRDSLSAPKANPDKDLTSQIDAAFTAAAAANGVSEAILRGIAATESHGNICAKSPAGALGLMQLMPAMAKLHGVRDPLDAVSSVWGAAAHYAYMLKRASEIAKYTPSANLEKIALTMYNCGESRYLISLRTGKPLPNESKEYAEKVISAKGAKLSYHCDTAKV